MTRRLVGEAHPEHAGPVPFHHQVPPARRQIDPSRLGRRRVLRFHHRNGRRLTEPTTQDTGEFRMDVLHQECEG